MHYTLSSIGAQSWMRARPTRWTPGTSMRATVRGADGVRLALHTLSQATRLILTENVPRSPVWFFPSNLAHTVVGLEDGCEYIAGCAPDSKGLAHYRLSPCASE